MTTKTDKIMEGLNMDGLLRRNKEDQELARQIITRHLPAPLPQGNDEWIEKKDELIDEFMEEVEEMKIHTENRDDRIELRQALNKFVDNLPSLPQGKIDGDSEFDDRDNDLANIFNTTETKSDLYMRIIDYLVKKGFLQKGEQVDEDSESQEKEECKHLYSPDAKEKLTGYHHCWKCGKRKNNNPEPTTTDEGRCMRCDKIMGITEKGYKYCDVCFCEMPDEEQMKDGIRVIPDEECERVSQEKMIDLHDILYRFMPHCEVEECIAILREEGFINPEPTTTPVRIEPKVKFIVNVPYPEIENEIQKIIHTQSMEITYEKARYIDNELLKLGITTENMNMFGVDIIKKDNGIEDIRIYRRDYIATIPILI